MEAYTSMEYKKIDLMDIVKDRKDILSKRMLTFACLGILTILIIAFWFPEEAKMWVLIGVIAIYLVIIGLQVKEIITITKTANKNAVTIQPYLDETIFYSKARYVVTKNAVVSIDSAFAVIDYEDIVLMNKETGAKVRNSVSKEDIVLEVWCKDESYYWFYVSVENSEKHGFETYDFSDLIKEKNPRCFVGKTRENIEAVYDKYGIRIN